MSGLVNPQNLLSALKSVSRVRYDGPARGPGWRGTRYSFSATFSDAIAGTIHGTVYVDRQGRVRQVTLPMALTANDASATGIKSITYDLTFGDFGAPVPVTAPPASQVYAPAGTYFTYPALYFVGPPPA